MPNQYTNGTAGMTPLERFFHYVEFTDTCWLWHGSMFPNGYGQFPIKREKGHLAHRWFYEKMYGPIEDGLDLDHLCRVRHCVNVFQHLEPVTRLENLTRGVGIIAEQLKRTHCPKGHPYSDENTYMDQGTHRKCKECNRVRCRTYKARRKIEALRGC